MSSAGSQARFFSNLFGQKVDHEPSGSSVLDQWNQYASSSTDQGFADGLDKMEQGSSSLQQIFSSSYSKFTGGMQGISSGLGPQFSSFQMPSANQLAYFAALLGSGIVFLILAFTLFLPVIMLAPSKFAVCFTTGSALILSAFAALRGWRTQLQHMFTSDRIPFTIAYFGSMAGTLYAALAMHSYVLSVLCCAIQVVALLYYTLSYFPGGTHGLKYIFYSFKSAAMQCFLAVVRR